MFWVRRHGGCAVAILIAALIASGLYYLVPWRQPKADRARRLLQTFRGDSPILDGHDPIRAMDALAALGDE